MKNLYSTVLFFLLISTGYAQCAADETEIQLTVTTDDWGYELYWQIVETGSDCSATPIVWGGNDSQVGCDGGAQQDASGGNGYANNAVVPIDPFCLTTGVSYDLVFVDDWGDGGMSFEMFEDGLLSHFYVGEGAGNVWTFEVGNSGLPEYDSPCGAYDITVDGDSLLLNNEAAIAQIGEIVPPGGNCTVFGAWCEGGVAHSVWATFTAPADGSYVVSTCAEGNVVDTQVAVYTYSDCGDQSTFNLVSSNDDMLGGCGAGNYYSSECYVSCATTGTQYLVQIDGWFGSVGDIVLNVNSWSGESVLQAAVGDILCSLPKGEPGNGSIMPYVIGWGSDFEASWTGPGGFTSTDNFVYDLDPGVYSFTATNPCTGEQLSQEWTIGNPAPYFVQIDVMDAACSESFDASISVNVSGATPPYMAEWTGPLGYFNEGMSVDGLDDGLYNLLLTDDNGCEYAQEINVSVLNDFSFDLGPDTTICEDGSLFLFGPAEYIYEWQDGSVNQFYIVEGSDFGPGAYSFILHASSLDGCDFTDVIIVNIDNCNGIEEYLNGTSSLYPNPNDGNFTLQNLPAINHGLMQLVDAHGNIVESKSLNVGEGSNLLVHTKAAKGIYLLRLFDGSQWASKRVVISN